MSNEILPTKRTTPRSRRRLAVAGVAVSLGLLGAACSSSSTTSPGSSTAPTTVTGTTGKTGTTMVATAMGSDTKAAGVRATLTDQLTTHVYLAGIAINTAVNSGADSAAFKAAAATLDKNTVELSDTVGTVYGKPGGDQFKELWRKHIGFFVDYTMAKAGNDTAKADKAKADLDGYRNDFGAFLEAATEKGLPKQAVADELKPHVESLFAAIDKSVAKDAGVFDALQTAAGHMPHTAEVLAGAIVKQKKIEGDPASKPSELRSSLTYLLDEHVYLAGIAINQAVATAPDSESTKAAIATLDKNTVALSDAVGSVYGEAGGDQFKELWRKHIGFFVEYTLAKAGNDTAKADKAKADLDGYRNDFGAFLESATEKGLSKQAVADELKPHVESLFAAIDKVVAKDAGLFDALKAAAGHMPHTAEVLAGAIAKQKMTAK